jgi:PST family polysaccharide transporter
MKPKRTFGHALKWAVVMNSGRRAMATVFTFLLAALLGPHDFGVVAVALVFVAFVRMLLEQGFATAIIQREDLEDEHLDSAFWLNLAWCGALAGACAVAAGYWADLNDMPELGPVIQVLSLVIVLDGLQIVQQAVMERQLDFKQLAIRTNASVLIGGLVGIPLAVAGAGVWALVGQQLAMEIVLVALIWRMTTWHPRFRFSVRHARDLLGFSGSVFAANLAGFLNRRADALLLGLFFGPVAVGVYRIADRIVDVVVDVTMRPLALVSLPVLSRLQDKRHELRAMTTRLLRTTLLATVPALMVVFACSDEILAVLGQSWEPGGDALKLLCLVGLGKAISFYTGPVLFAASRPRFRAVMLWAVAAVSTTVVLVVGAALASSSVRTQVVGMAGSRAILLLPILVPVNLLIVAHFTGLRLRSLLSALPGPLLAGAAGIACERLLRSAGVADGLAPLPTLLLIGGASAIVAVAVLLVLEPGARLQIAELRADLRALRRRDLEPAVATGKGNAL